MSLRLCLGGLVSQNHCKQIKCIERPPSPTQGSIRRHMWDFAIARFGTSAAHPPYVGVMTLTWCGTSPDVAVLLAGMGTAASHIRGRGGSTAICGGYVRQATNHSSRGRWASARACPRWLATGQTARRVFRLSLDTASASACRLLARSESLCTSYTGG